MLHICRKYFFSFLLCISIFVLTTAPAYASLTITSVTLNGGSSVSVAPSASITAVVNVTTTAGGSANWQGTSWTVNGSTTCENTPNNNGAGSYSESFTITAPASAGSYNADFITYSNNGCSANASSTYTLTNGIVVVEPTPTPGPSATPGPEATPTPAPSITYYPTVTLNPYAPNPTNTVPLTFWGVASIEQGTITTVEYTVNEGIDWLSVTSADGSFNSKEEYFTFTTANLPEGIYTIQVRAKSAVGVYTQEETYASDIVTIATTPPVVTLDPFIPNPTKIKTPTLSGSASAKLVDLSKVEVSIDNGKSWQITHLSGNTFSITMAPLEDGNYPIHVRAIDRLGNIGQGITQTLIIDTIPPIIGGGMQSLGPQILTPNKYGRVSIVAGIETTIAMSMKGGVTAAEIKTDTKSFTLSKKEGTNIWFGSIMFASGGEKPLTVSAIDGAGNKTKRQYNTLHVLHSGIVVDAKTRREIERASVTLYVYEPVSQQWIVWEAESYGQKNPQQTDKKGGYSFMVPPGKYYLEVQTTGFKSMQSEIITASDTSILNYVLPLTSKPKIEFTLPVFGKIILTTPSFFPPETFLMPKTDSKSNIPTLPDTILGGPAPNFSLPNLENKNIHLDQFKGQKMIVSFIAPWSSLSQEQAPFLSEASSGLPENQAILVILLQESSATTQTMMKRGNYGFPVVSDKDGSTATNYNVTILPHHVFIDVNGQIQKTYTGVLTKEELLHALEKIP